MRCPPVRASLVAAVAFPAVLTVLATPGAAQRYDVGISPLVEATVAVLITLVVGGGLIALAPEYTDRTTRRILDEPGETLLYGIGIGILASIGLFVLIITVVGIVLAVPLVIVLIVVGELGYLAAGRTLADSWGVALLGAMLASAVVGGVPVLGALIGIVLSSFGIGAAYLDYRDDGPSGAGPSEGESSGPKRTDRMPRH